MGCGSSIVCGGGKMNKVVVISNAKFEPGLIAFINSYKKAEMKTPLVIIDTGLENSYPYETVKKTFNGKGLKHAPWMTDCSPYLQLELGDINADKIIYLEVDMLLLKNIDHLFDEITDTNVIAVMDDAALVIELYNIRNHIDNCGRFFTEGSELRKKYLRTKGYNCGLVGGTRLFYEKLQNKYKCYLVNYENQYRLLAQSLLNQYFNEEHIFVKDVGLQNNFSGINEYYKFEQMYNVNFENDRWEIEFCDFPINVLHFTGKNKPFLNNDQNIMRPVWEYFYNKGKLF